MDMRQATIALIVVLGLGVVACDTGSKPPGQAKPADKPVDIIKTQREVLEQAKTVQGTVDAAAEDRQKSLERSEGK
jgi:hypothetical protein